MSKVSKTVSKSKEIERYKLKFIMHLDQAMANYEGFYREDLDEQVNKLDEIKGSDGFKNRKEKSEAFKFQKDKVKAMRKSIKNYKNINYKLLDIVNSNMGESSTDRLEGVGEVIDNIVNELFDNEKNLDMSILLTAYFQGELNDVLTKIKKILNETE